MGSRGGERGVWGREYGGREEGGQTGGVGGWRDGKAGPGRALLWGKIKILQGGGVQTAAGQTASSTGRVVSGVGGTEGSGPLSPWSRSQRG